MAMRRNACPMVAALALTMAGAPALSETPAEMAVNAFFDICVENAPKFENTKAVAVDEYGFVHAGGLWFNEDYRGLSMNVSFGPHGNLAGADFCSFAFSTIHQSDLNDAFFEAVAQKLPNAEMRVGPGAMRDQLAHAQTTLDGRPLELRAVEGPDASSLHIIARKGSS